MVRHVADGGFSSVYEVRPATPETVDRHGGAPRALKCVWGTPAELTAMNNEAARTQDVDGHPGVLTLVTSFRFERSTAPHHHVGLVLELADEDLPTFGARVGPDERAWAAVFEQVAAGLAHIHARRVVHGDIKPTNVLRIGARFAVADFGVSAPLESTRSAGIGLARTIAFWPPESATQGVLQADGVRRPPVEGWRASQAGDVWALAVSAHRMLTGRHITAGTTPEQQYELVCLGRYAVDGRLGPGWRRLLEDCLVQDPRRRRVTTSAQLRERLAELAVPSAYTGVPWPAGSPRLAALVDLDPAAGGPLLALSLDRPGGRVSGELVPADGVLPAALLHLTEDVLPNLAARTAAPNGATLNGAGPNGAGPRAAGPHGAPLNGAAPNGAALNGAGLGGAGLSAAGLSGGGPNGAGLSGAGPHGAALNGAGLSGAGLSGAARNGAAANGGGPPMTVAAAGPGARAGMPADPAATQMVSLAELERTRQLNASVSAQRDQLAADRDRIARSRDDVVADRDRLRRDHEVARPPAGPAGAGGRSAPPADRRAGEDRGVRAGPAGADAGHGPGPPGADHGLRTAGGPATVHTGQEPVARHPATVHTGPGARAPAGAEGGAAQAAVPPDQKDDPPAHRDGRRAGDARGPRRRRHLRGLRLHPGPGDEPGGRDPRPGPRRGFVTVLPQGLVRARLVCPGRPEVQLGPGESVSFGRSAPRPTADLAVSDSPRVSRKAGTLDVTPFGVLLTNTGSNPLFVDEGAVRHTVRPGQAHLITDGRVRVGFAGTDDGLELEVAGAVRPGDVSGADEATAERTRPAWSLLEGTAYFACLVALCEPTLRHPDSPWIPTSQQVADRLVRARPDPRAAHGRLGRPPAGRRPGQAPGGGAAVVRGARPQRQHGRAAAGARPGAVRRAPPRRTQGAAGRVRDLLRHRHRSNRAPPPRLTVTSIGG